MRDYVERLNDEIAGLVKGREVFLANVAGERSDFIRFNRSALRQQGTVAELGVAIDLIEGRRQATGRAVLTGRIGEDRARLRRLIADLRAGLGAAPEDPHLLYNEQVRATDRIARGRLPRPKDVIAALDAAGWARDMVGIYAGGTIWRGFANSLGQRNWDESESFNLDWSFYVGGDKAVKAAYAGTDWDGEALDHHVAAAAARLEALARPPRTVPPGDYRVFLAPAAVEELLGLLAWGGFGLAAHKTRATPLLRLVEGTERLSPLVTLRENTAEGVAPGFQREGFIKPPCVDLIVAGVCRDTLVSPRTAVEYGAPTNGAGAREAPASIDMAPGDLAEADILRRLGSGLYVSNLWYLNFSDRSAGRMTGMTRFASFWVEDGEIVAPLSVMRFDDTVYRLFGENLEALTAERETRLDPSTYDGRSTDSARVPGALLSAMRFTL